MTVVKARSTFHTVASAIILSMFLIVPVGAPALASADPVPDGLWYYNSLKVQEAHDAGWTGKGVTIAVIDSQLNLAVPTLAGADIELPSSVACTGADGKDLPATSADFSASHATNVVSFIVGSGAGYSGQQGVKGVAPGAKILFFAAGGSTPGDASDEMNCNSDLVDASAITTAVARGAQIISVSLGVESTPELIAAIAAAERAGVVILGALPNETTVDAKAPAGNFPAAANGVVTVQAIGVDNLIEATDGKPNVFPETKTDIAGPGIALLTQGSSDPNRWEGVTIGDGTSYATPIIAGFLAVVKQKYPAATGNQLIQTLIRNTGNRNHLLSRDAKGEVGFGVASLTHMLQVDPTTYPDVNPLVSTELNQTPTPQQLGVSPSATQLSPARNVTETVLTSCILPVTIGGTGLVSIITILIVVIVRRRRRGVALPSGTGD